MSNTAQTTDLTTLANAKEYLRITSTDDDNMLQRLISSCSIEMQTYINRNFAVQQYTDNFIGKDKNYHVFKINPVQSIVSIKVINFDQNYYVPTILFYDTKQVFIDGLFKKSYLNYPNCQIVYTAGYNQTPFDVEQACIEWVGVKYKQIESLNMSSKSIAQETTAFIVKDIPDFVKVVLEQYKNYNIA
jgi:hypothetical protein